MKEDHRASEELDLLSAVGPQMRRILRQRIIRNDFKPGTKISESALAKDYEISRQPIREAFITLEHENLLEIRPQRGTFIKPIEVEAVLSARFVREATEADVVRKLAEKPDPILIKELRQQLEVQKDVLNFSAELFMSLDEKFHRTLASGCGMEGIWGYLDMIKSQMDRVRHISYEQYPFETLVKQHSDIVDGIAEGNPDLAESAMRTHLREILKSLPEIRKLHPEFFNSGKPKRSGK